MFVGLVVVLVVFVLIGLLSVYGKDGFIGWDEFVRFWIVRFLIVGVLVWLVLYVS